MFEKFRNNPNEDHHNEDTQIGHDAIKFPQAMPAELKESLRSKLEEYALRIDESKEIADSTTTNPELDQAMRRYLTDLFKFQILQSLLESNSADRQLVRQNMRAANPSFHDDAFDAAFDSVVLRVQMEHDNLAR